MKNGMINLDSKLARKLGFTSKRFEGYLWKKDNAVVISFIVSKQRGNFRQLVRAIHDCGWTVEVPTPLGRMEDIVLKNGYKHKLEPFSDDFPEPCDVWYLEPPQCANPTPETIHGT